MAAGGKDKEDLDLFLTALALCHNIVIDQETGAYNAASPDELALVNFAKQQGTTFGGFDDDDNMIVETAQGPQKYKLLHVCEFTSARKRMSVIVRDPQGKVKLYCKGADSFVADLLNAESKGSELFK